MTLVLRLKQDLFVASGQNNLLIQLSRGSCPTKPCATMPKGIIGNGVHGP